VKQYDGLRSTQVATPKLLIVLFLPPKPEDWLDVSVSHLVLKNCAYWVSLRGADAIENETGKTIYIPEENIFNQENLIKISNVIADGGVICYE